MPLLRRTPTLNVLHHHLSAAAAADSHALSLAKLLSTVFVLSPSPVSAVDRLSPLRHVITPSVASAAVERLSDPNFALGFFNLARSDLEIPLPAGAYHHVIALLQRSGRQADALKVFDQMASDGHSVDDYFFESLLSSFMKSGDLDSSVGLAIRGSKLGCRFRRFAFNSLLSLLISRNRVQDAIFIFGECSKSQLFVPDTCSFNVILKGYCRLGDIDEALRFFNEMGSFGCLPDTITHNILIDALCKSNRVEQGHKILRGSQAHNAWLPNVVTFTSVISGYCKVGKMDMAFKVFEEMVGLEIRPSRFTYNVLIDGFGKARDMLSALSMYKRMMSCGCPPDVVTFTSLINGYCRSGHLDDAMRLWHEMGIREIRPNVYTFSIIINSLCKMNRISEAQVLLKELNGREDIVARAFVYNPVIDGFCKAGNLEAANSILSDMKEKGCKPDKFTYTILIIGHCMRGRTLEAINIFNNMAATGCKPDVITVRSLVSCLLKAGMPTEANRITIAASGKDLGLCTSSLKEVPSSLTKSADVSVAV